MLQCRLTKSIVVVAVLGITCVLVREAAAQSPGAAETSTEPALAQELSSAPVPGQGGVSVTAGTSLQGGRTETKGYSIDAIIAHTNKRRQLLRVDFEATFAKYRPAPGAPLIQVEDNVVLSGTFLHPLRPHWSAIGIGGWRRDRVLQLDHRAWVEGGIGFHAIEHRMANLLIAPTFAIGSERRLHTDEGNGVRDFGILQSLALKVHEKLGIEEFVHAHFDTRDADDRTLTFNTSLMTKVAPHTGLKVYYQHHYDALPPPGSEKLQYTVGLGVQISFTKPAPPAAKP